MVWLLVFMSNCRNGDHRIPKLNTDKSQCVVVINYLFEILDY